MVDQGKPRNWGDLAAALGVSQGYLSKLRRRPWWPKGLEPHQVDEARAALDANVGKHAKRGRESAPDAGDQAAPRAAPSSGPAAPSYSPRGSLRFEGDLLEQLEADELDAVTTATIALKLARLKLAQEARAGSIGAKSLEDVKKAIAEVRAARASYVTLAQREGELLPRSVAVATAGELARRFVAVLQDLESLVASQVLMWEGDPAWRTKSVYERQREVRDWFSGKAAEFRQLAATGIGALLEEVAAE